jgi:hypothetical protein
MSSYAVSAGGGFIFDCDIEVRDGEMYCSLNPEGVKVVTLRGYKILPREVYNIRMGKTNYTWTQRLAYLFTGKL